MNKTPKKKKVHLSERFVNSDENASPRKRRPERADADRVRAREMTRENAREKPPQRWARRRTDPPPNPPPGEAWGIIGTLVAGAGFWGSAGLGLDRLLGFEALFFPIGLILGMVASIYLVIYRFGASR